MSEIDHDFTKSDATQVGHAPADDTDPQVKLDRSAILDHGRRIVALEQRLEDLTEMVRSLVKNS